MEFKFRMIVVIVTDCIGSCKSNYHTIMTTMAPGYPNTVKHVNKGHSREPEKVPLMSSCPLYTG